MARWFAVTFCFVTGAVFLVLAGLIFRDSWALLAVSRTAPGTVVAHEHVVSETSDGSVAGYFPVISFATPDGQKRSFRHKAPSYFPLSLRVGQSVEVLYDPANPSRARARTFFSLWGGVVLSGAFGVLSIGAGVLALRPSSSAALGHAVLRKVAFEPFASSRGSDASTRPSAGRVEARSIGMADGLLMEHLMQGGAVADSIGRGVVRQLVERAGEEPDVRRVIEEQHVTADELVAMYTGVVEDLMPDPAIDAPPPSLVPTQFFREPERLHSLLTGVAHEAEPRARISQLVARAIEEGRRIRQQAHEDPERSRIVFRITPSRGLDLSEAGKARRAWSSGLGCATAGLVPLSLGLLFTGWFLYGESNTPGLVIGVLVLLFALLWIHTGLHMLPWPANLITGLVILAAGVGWVWSTQRFVATAARAEGVVTGFGVGQDVTPIIRFSAERGETVEFTVWTPLHRKLALDQHVAVRYDPRLPARAAVDSFATLWLNAVTLTLFGAALVASVVYVHRHEGRSRGEGVAQSALSR